MLSALATTIAAAHPLEPRCHAGRFLRCARAC